MSWEEGSVDGEWALIDFRLGSSMSLPLGFLYRVKADGGMFCSVVGAKTG